MSEEHVSTSAVAQHFEYQLEVAALAHQYYEEEGRPEGRSQDHWQRAEEEIRRRRLAQPESAPSDPPAPSHGEAQAEEAMQLGR